MANRQNWRTPQWLFDALNERFGPFVLDAAASKENALCKRYHDGVRSDGLSNSWMDRTFCNPPFSHAGDWVEKAWGERTAMCRSVLLLPVGCSQAWFHDWVLRSKTAHILYPTKRISFLLPDGTPTKNADRDTMIVTFGYPGPKVSSFEVKR
ncbi:unnamed protein product [marine sediment metagenome]|uniref:DNA N-6-adenine-methyltransferase (Dam) n=1 Tax=marine sediment metagenome TaxID=412755 RepID=X0SKH5_9ZZZZ